MKRRIWGASVAALLGLWTIHREAVAVDVPTRTAVYTRVAGTSGPACNSYLPRQIPSNLTLPIQVPGAASVIPVGAHRRYGGYYGPSYRANYYRPNYTYRPGYLHAPYYHPYGYGGPNVYGGPYFQGGFSAYYGGPFYGGAYFRGPYYGGANYGGPAFYRGGYGAGYGGCYHW